MSASPASPSPHAQQLSALMASGQFGPAKHLATQILQTNGGEPNALKAIAHIATMQGLWAEASVYAQRAVHAAPNDDDAAHIMARALAARGDSQAALEWCDKGLALNPGSPPILQTKASILERIGRTAESRDLLLPLARDPERNPAVALILAKCFLRERDPEAALRILDEELDHPRLKAPEAARARVQYLLLRAKTLDALKRYDEAFAAAGEARSIGALPFDSKQYEAQFDALMRAFSKSAMAKLARARPSRATHVFIAGMPRSGTTLVEQIIDAHPDARGVGEVKEIDIFARRLPQAVGAFSAYPDCVELLQPQHAEQMARLYEKALADYGFTGASCFVNKNLRNSIHLGFISLLFPNARIIVIRRDPRDVAVSCYFGAFRAEMHPDLFSMESIALAHTQFERIMSHWKEVLPVEMLEVRYEDLIADQDAHTRRMIDFTGLPWNDRCLRFWESDRTVMTLSYDQVTRPIYTSSVARYRNYEKHLAPVAALVPGGPPGGPGGPGGPGEASSG